MLMKSFLLNLDMSSYIIKVSLSGRLVAHPNNEYVDTEVQCE